jgi:uncharacterized membrane protein
MSSAASTSVWLRRVMIGITVLGIALASYLVYVHYSGARPACTAGQACLKVQTSVWSKVGPIPVSLIGLIGYIAIFFALIAPDRDETRIITLGMTLIGVCFSGYLTYRELFTIHLVCEECAASAVMQALLFIGSVWRFLITDDLAGMAPAAAAGPGPAGSPTPGKRSKAAV